MLLLHVFVSTAQSASQPSLGMTTAGWFFMLFAWTAIISVAVFCYRKVLQKAAEKRQQALSKS